MRTKSFYYITHIDNLPSIIKHGILSHERIGIENVQGISMFKRQKDKKENVSRKSKTGPQNLRKQSLALRQSVFSTT